MYLGWMRPLPRTQLGPDPWPIGTGDKKRYCVTALNLWLFAMQQQVTDTQTYPEASKYVTLTCALQPFLSLALAPLHSSPPTKCNIITKYKAKWKLYLAPLPKSISGGISCISPSWVCLPSDPPLPAQALLSVRGADPAGGIFQAPAPGAL